jgi:lipopolysaccharide/colanic/teichoic acid biosynthesis glycosyltransferase
LPSDALGVRPYRGQRVLDLVVLIVGAIPAVVVGLVCAVAVRLDSRGPVVFRQERIGRDAQPFVLLKFRTMIDAPQGNPLFPDAERVTHVGRLLRRTSLDELPQLLNVLKGEMSIVGPRPTLAYQVARYDARQHRRLLVRPGLTGLAQLRGRNAITWGERIEHDLEYVQRQSLGLDLRVMLGTPLTLVHGRGTEGHPVDDPIATPPEDG